MRDATLLPAEACCRRQQSAASSGTAARWLRQPCADAAAFHHVVKPCAGSIATWEAEPTSTAARRLHHARPGRSLSVQQRGKRIKALRYAQAKRNNHHAALGRSCRIRRHERPHAIASKAKNAHGYSAKRALTRTHTPCGGNTAVEGRVLACAGRRMYAVRPCFAQQRRESSCALCKTLVNRSSA